jgi:2-amino-4-hydroxy-6-hydroxymethyldihydropteridine diphosphokinase
VRVYLGVGSNIEPEANIRRGLKALGQAFGEVQCSPLYQAPAWGFDGPDFINLAVGFDATVSFVELNQILKRIEQHCGRDRAAETCKGSRTLDLDVLLFGTFRGEIEGCQLPRPELFERQFVWQPLQALLQETAALSDFEAGVQQELEELASNAELLSPMREL